MNASEQFEKWYSANYAGELRDHSAHTKCERTWDAAWQASRAAALEEAYQAANNESLTDHTGHPEDIAYNGAIRDCLDAIGALAKGVSE